MSTAFLGPRGTFSEDAALIHAGPDADLMAFGSIPALTAAVETGLANQAVMPIENSIEGSVSTTLDLLIHETPLKISAEIVVPVRHFLVTTPGTALADIRIVTSHPQALGQCRKFLERCLPNAEQVAALSTAGAVEEVAFHQGADRAAIGTARAAELYGGQVLARDIQDVRTNVTRFVILSESDAAPTGQDKTSIGFTIKANVPGALFSILEPFARESIQLTKIESRPTKAWLWEYVFLVDFEGHRIDAQKAAVLDEISQHCETLNVFGSYPRFRFESSTGFPDLPTRVESS
ncbi:prephenate dehydratase [soil metagenome]